MRPKKLRNGSRPCRPGRRVGVRVGVEVLPKGEFPREDLPDAVAVINPSLKPDRLNLYRQIPARARRRRRQQPAVRPRGPTRNRLHPEPAFALLSRFAAEPRLPRGHVGTHSEVDLIRSAALAVSRSVSASTRGPLDPGRSVKMPVSHVPRFGTRATSQCSGSTTRPHPPLPLSYMT